MMHLDHIHMSDKRFDKISDMIQKSYPNSCILYIKEVFNPSLHEAYMKRREQIESIRGEVEEKQLFHGTFDSLITTIAQEGFDPTKNTTSAFGYGTYFAKHAGYSMNYMRSTTSDITYMFLADVLVGKCVDTRQFIDKNNQTEPTSLFEWDNNVDNLEKPTIYTTPYSSGAYPRYIIAFHKNAS
jgi:hypothetical protein